MENEKPIINWKSALIAAGVLLVLAAMVISLLVRSSPGSSGCKDCDADSSNPGIPEISLDSDQKILSEWIAINSDVIMVVYIDYKSYPVVLSKDNTEYLSDDNQEFAYVDMNYLPEDNNLVIYGNSSAKNDKMFMQFKHSDFIKNNQVFWIETDEGLMNYQIVGYVLTTTEDEDFLWWNTKFLSDMQLNSYLAAANKNTKISLNYSDLESESVVTLVTCDLSKGLTNKRIVIVAIPV